MLTVWAVPVALAKTRPAKAVNASGVWSFMVGSVVKVDGVVVVVVDVDVDVDVDVVVAEEVQGRFTHGGRHLLPHYGD